MLYHSFDSKNFISISEEFLPSNQGILCHDCFVKMIRFLFGYSGNFTDNSVCDFYNLSTVLTQAITPYASILCD